MRRITETETVNHERYWKRTGVPDWRGIFRSTETTKNPGTEYEKGFLTAVTASVDITQNTDPLSTEIWIMLTFQQNLIGYITFPQTIRSILFLAVSKAIFRNDSNPTSTSCLLIHARTIPWAYHQNKGYFRLTQIVIIPVPRNKFSWIINNIANTCRNEHMQPKIALFIPCYKLVTLLPYLYLASQ